LSSSNEDNEKKKKQNPFDFLSDKDLKHIFDEMKEYIESESFKEMVEDIISQSYHEKQPMNGLFDINETDSIHPDIDEAFDHNIFLDDKNIQKKPTADIMKDETHVMVTINIPNVKKDHISLFATESDIEIVIERDENSFYDIIDLPALVEPATAKSTYKNGILDIVIKRKQYLTMGMNIEVQ
jgi:HSP20 family protein